jgi:hypothetical protein
MTTRLRNVPRGLVLENDDTQSRVNSDYGEKVRSDRDARFSGPEASRHRRCSADCITNTRESEFSVHTTGRSEKQSKEIRMAKGGLRKTNTTKDLPTLLRLA